MDQHRTRIVVGEGQTLRRGLLRFVLEGEGYEVVAEAGSSAELARMVAVHEPDVVVLDDGIGATAVQMARELAPKAKVILVWPGAVVPIGGDARVEPAEVLKELATAVQKVTAHPAPITETLRRPAWIDRVRKDPATLRDLLEKRGGLPRRPSVTELQRRGQRLHPVGRPEDERGAADPSDAGSATPDETPPPPVPDDTDRPAAPVVILPVPGAPGTEEPILVLSGEGDAATPAERDDVPPTSDATDEDTARSTPVATPKDGASGVEGKDAERRDAAVIALPTAATAGPAAEPADPAAAWNRRLGSIALGGAAVAGALVLALSLGGSRVPTDVLAAQPPIAGAEAPEPFDGDAGALDPDGTVGAAPDGPTLAAVPPTPDPAPDRNDVRPPVTEPPIETPPEEPPEEPPTEPPSEPPSEPPGGPPSDGGLPGASARNPHGGPPGLTGDAPDTPGGPPADAEPGNGNGPGAGNGTGGGNGNGPGNGNGNGPPAQPPGQGGRAAHVNSHVHKR